MSKFFSHTETRNEKSGFLISPKTLSRFARKIGIYLKHKGQSEKMKVKGKTKGLMVEKVENSGRKMRSVKRDKKKDV